MITQFAFVLLVRKGNRDPTCYHVRRIWEHAAIPGPVWRMTKDSGEHYDVALTEHGPTCECKGWLRWGHCRHIRGLMKEGLLRRGA